VCLWPSVLDFDDRRRPGRENNDRANYDEPRRIALQNSSNHFDRPNQVILVHRGAARRAPEATNTPDRGGSVDHTESFSVSHVPRSDRIPTPEELLPLSPSIQSRPHAHIVL